MKDYRKSLIDIALAWEKDIGNFPKITSAISEYDAATMIVGMSHEQYASSMLGVSQVRKGFDFEFQGVRYQIKADRIGPGRGEPSANRKPSNWCWDKFIWIKYNDIFHPLEAWLWNVKDFRERFENFKSVRPKQLRLGLRVI